MESKQRSSHRKVSALALKDAIALLRKERYPDLNRLLNREVIGSNFCLQFSATSTTVKCRHDDFRENNWSLIMSAFIEPKDLRESDMIVLSAKTLDMFIEALK